MYIIFSDILFFKDQDLLSLKEMGPRATLKVRRSKLASDTNYK